VCGGATVVCCVLGGAALVGACVEVYGTFELVGGADVGVDGELVGVDGLLVGVDAVTGVLVGEVGVSGLFVGDVGVDGVIVGVGYVVVGPIGGVYGGRQPGNGGRQPGNGMMIGIGIGPFGLGTKPGMPGVPGDAGTGAGPAGVPPPPGEVIC
jgi:hypothetical protein